MSIPSSKRRPDFIIIGAMKCMTSTLHVQLAAQPGVFMTHPKEPCYFSDDDHYRKGPEWYSSLFSAAHADDLCGESSTHYTKLPTYPQTVARLQQACPEVRLIYVMRHPIDRLMSQYVHEWTKRLVNDPIDRAVQKYPELVSYSRYAYQLESYLSAFGPRQILPVFFDRLARHPQAELERICRFIGYRGVPSWRPELADDNVSARRMRASRWRDRLVYAPGVNWIRRTLVPQPIRDGIKQLWQMKRKPTISADRLQELKAVFDRDLTRLGDWLGVGLSCDLFRETTADRVFDWRDGLEQELAARQGVPEAVI